MRTSALMALTMIVAIGCASPAGSVGPSSTSSLLPSPSAAAPTNSAAVTAEPSTPAPSTSTSPGPSAPPDLARTAVKERDDIRVEIELQRNPLPAGEPSWVKVRVTNEGRTNVTWFHDGCAEPVFVQGVSKVAWSMGEEQRQAAMFKTYVLGGSIAAPPDSHGVMTFVRKEGLHSGPTGCADVGISETVKPGKTVGATRWWSGFTDLNRALPPDGPATFRGFAGYYWRGQNQPTDITDHAIKLKLDAWIVSDAAAARLSPAQAVDAALSDPTFAIYIDSQAIANGRATIAWYDAARDVWEIGVMPWYETEPPRIHGVLVDAVTGAIRGPLDRPWDSNVDPFP